MKKWVMQNLDLVGAVVFVIGALMVLGALGGCSKSTPPPQQQSFQQQPQFQQPQQPIIVEQQAPPQQYAPAPAQAPVIVQAAPQSSGVGDFMMGAMIGHMMTSQAPAPTVINRSTIVQRTTVVRQNSAPRPSYSRPSATSSRRGR